MESRLLGSINACLFALATTLSIASPLEGHLPVIPGGTDYQAYAASMTIGDISTVPATVWVVVIALIGLNVIARRSSSRK